MSAKTSPSRSTSAALWQAISTRSPAAAPSSSALTLARSPENRSTLSIRRWQVVSSESAASVERAIDGNRISRSKLRLDREEPARVVDPAEVVAALLAQVVRLDQGDPGPLGEEVGRMAEAGRVDLVEPRAAVRVDRVPAVERALGLGVERPDRLDLVAEELDPDRVGGVGREDVEDAAAEAELAGDLDDLDPRHARDPAASAVSSSTGTASPTATRRDIRASASGFGTGCSIAWNGATTSRGGSAPASRLSTRSRRPKTSSAGVQLARQLLPGREDLGRDPGERRHVVAEVVHVADVGQDDHQGRGRMQAQRRRRSAPPADPQAPSIVALRPFLSAARTSGNPGARWISRVRSLRHFGFWILDFGFC